MAKLKTTQIGNGSCVYLPADTFGFSAGNTAIVGTSAARIDKSDTGAYTRYCSTDAYNAKNISCTTSNSTDTNLEIVQVGTNSVSIGYHTTATGIAATAIGAHTSASGCIALTAGKCTSAKGTQSVSFGYASISCGENSFAVGSGVCSIGNASIAGGTASSSSLGYASVAIGFNAVAYGSYSAAFNKCTRSCGYASAALGNRTTASGAQALALGNTTTACGFVAISAGFCNVTADAYNFSMGCCSNRITFEMDTGNGYFDGSADVGNADYAEYFQHVEDSCLDRGVFASLADGTNKVCAGNTDIIGIVSSDPAIVGDAQYFKWKDKYKTDEFGRKVIEKHIRVDVVEATVDEIPDGNDFKTFVTELITSREPNNYFNLGEEQTLIELQDFPETCQVGEQITFNIKYETTDEVVNPNYDPDAEYVPRAERPEWSPIGLLGKLWVYKADLDVEYNVGDYVTSNTEGKAVITTKGDPLGAWRILEVSQNLLRVLFK